MAQSVHPRIAVIGGGYVGTVVAAAFASLGRPTVVLEVDHAKTGALSRGNVPFHEPGLEPLVRACLDQGLLRFTPDGNEAMERSDVVFLCVGTPAGADGKPDVGAIRTAAAACGAVISRYHVLVTKSTVPLGTNGWLRGVVDRALPKHLRGSSRELYAVVSNPEFLRQGTAVDDFLHPSRVILGGDDAAAVDLVAEAYRPILEQSFPGGRPDSCPVLIRTDPATAEMSKYASNAFLAARLSLINEIANLCEAVDADIDQVVAAIGLDPRIGPRFLQPGIGWGGSCLGKDLDALIGAAEERGYRPSVLPGVLQANTRQRKLVVEKLERHLGDLSGRRIALLGLSFKPGTDDLRDSPAVFLAQALLLAGASVSAFDPMVRTVPGVPQLSLAGDAGEAVDGADAIVLATDWPEFRVLDPHALRARASGDLVVDGRNFLDRNAFEAAGFRYEGMGRGRRQPRVEVA